MDTRQDQAEAREPIGLTLAFVAMAAAASVFVRLVPYWFDVSGTGRSFWNLMPVGALGLFAGARLRSRWAYLVPTLVMLAADLLLIDPLAQRGFASFTWLTPVIYACFVVNVVIGRLVRQYAWPVSVLPGCLLGSVQFFVATNCIAWLGGDGTLYPKTVAGLMECFTAALPFFGNTVAGDLLYTGLFFGLYAILVDLPQREKASQPV